MRVVSLDERGGERYVALNRRRTAPIALRSWYLLAVVWFGLRRHPLPHLVQRLGRPGRASHRRYPPRSLGRTVGRVLHAGPFRPRCLFGALILYRMLSRQGEAAELVIGLPETPADKDAHAWVECNGRDVGPPPGRRRHVELVRYG